MNFDQLVESVNLYAELNLKKIFVKEPWQCVHMAASTMLKKILKHDSLLGESHEKH